jgi:Ca2+-binding RTX toxin-like protein
VAVQFGGFSAGSEVLANTYTFGYQEYSSVTALQGGGFVVVWKSGSQVVAQRFTASGAKAGGEFTLGTSSDDPAIRALPGGGFAIAWSRSGDYAVVVQRYSQDGTAEGAPIVASPIDEMYRSMPQLAVLASGELVVAWAENLNGSYYDVRLQRIDSAGEPTGVPVLVNTVVDGSQYRPEIAPLANGGFAVKWMDNGLYGSPGYSGSDVEAQIFDSAGNKVGGEIQLDSVAAGSQTPGGVAALPSGGFVATWSRNAPASGGSTEYRIEAQIFDASGARVGPQLAVSAPASGPKHTPAVAVLSSGFFVVVWSDYSVTGDGRGGAVKAQLFDLAGVKIGGEFVVNSTTTGNQYHPSVAGLASGGFVVSWTDSSGLDGDSSPTAVKARTFEPGTAARDDSYSLLESAVATGSLFADTGAGADGAGAEIVAINGLTASVESTIVLASGALLTVNADGTFRYDPNGRFSSLPSPQSGAVNAFLEESFTYTLSGGATATVTMRVEGASSEGDRLEGDNAGNALVGSEYGELFSLEQGGDDSASGGAGADSFYFGGALTSADTVDGGTEVDQLAIQGDYAGANRLTLGAVSNVEQFVLLSGTDTRFGAPGGALHSYDITTVDQNVAAGQQMQIDGVRLRVGENFTFDGSAETDGSFLVWAGKGTDDLKGGAGNDGFLFRGNGNWSAADKVDGGAGIDQLGIRGNYAGANAIVFGAGQIAGIEVLALMSGTDTRFGAAIGDASYDVSMNDANLAAGARMTVDATFLRTAETLVFDGSAEADGSFRIFGGQAADRITGSQNADSIRGGLGGDVLTGAGGADTFVYRSAADSTGLNFDLLVDFDSAEDRLDLATGVSGSAGTVGAGRLDAASFNADLAAALDGALGANQAILFNPDEGSFAGRRFLIADGNGDGAYTQGQDYVFELGSGASVDLTGTAFFV